MKSFLAKLIKYKLVNIGEYAINERVVVFACDYDNALRILLRDNKNTNINDWYIEEIDIDQYTDNLNGK